ncbi:hypothetical protein [Kitasatospora sp. NPDC004272]
MRGTDGEPPYLVRFERAAGTGRAARGLCSHERPAPGRAAGGRTA